MKENKTVQVSDKIRGCPVGGAIGDALGYPVEFLGESEIFRQYGEGGIRAYDTDSRSGKALISDDTQMTLFTANGLLYALTRARVNGGRANLRAGAAQAYQDWLRTQTMRFAVCQERRENGERCVSWLADVAQLYERRAPGNTCMSALLEAGDAVCDAGNNSKGCGGVMRVSPMGLVDPDGMDDRQADLEGAGFASLTHGHPLGYMTAAVLTHILRRIVFSPDGQTLRQIVLDARDTVADLYAAEPYVKELRACIDRAVELSGNTDDDLDNIHCLGEGWVADEALAVAIYCALRHQDDFSAGVIAAVNHRGDSDSTGAITGNILGAWHGCAAIEPRWKDDLELRDVILELADDLFSVGSISAEKMRADPDWARKYIECRKGE